jgi:hypothetical protein
MGLRFRGDSYGCLLTSAGHYCGKSIKLLFKRLRNFVRLLEIFKITLHTLDFRDIPILSLESLVRLPHALPS